MEAKNYISADANQRKLSEFEKSSVNSPREIPINEFLKGPRRFNIFMTPNGLMAEEIIAR